jgi:hypothetical protein
LPSRLVMAELALEDTVLERKLCSSHVVAPFTRCSKDFLNARIGNSAKSAGLRARTVTQKIAIIRGER